MLVTIEVVEDEVFVVVGNVVRANTAYWRGSKVHMAPTQMPGDWPDVTNRRLNLCVITRERLVDASWTVR